MHFLTDYLNCKRLARGCLAIGHEDAFMMPLSQRPDDLYQSILDMHVSSPTSSGTKKHLLAYLLARSGLEECLLTGLCIENACKATKALFTSLTMCAALAPCLQQPAVSAPRMLLVTPQLSTPTYCCCSGLACSTMAC